MPNIVEQIGAKAIVGDVLLSFNKKNLFSRAISNIIDSDFSHSFIYIGHGRILESSINGVVIDELSKYLDYDKYYLSLRRIALNGDEAAAFVDYCKGFLGVKYGNLQLLYLALLFWLKLTEDKRYTKVDLPGIICSELIAKGMVYIHRFPFGEVSPANITPKDLARVTHVIV